MPSFAWILTVRELFLVAKKSRGSYQQSFHQNKKNAAPNQFLEHLSASENTRHSLSPYETNPAVTIKFPRKSRPIAAIFFLWGMNSIP